MHSASLSQSVSQSVTHRIHGILRPVGGLLWVGELEVEITTNMHMHIVLGDGTLRLHVQGSEGEERTRQERTGERVGG